MKFNTPLYPTVANGVKGPDKRHSVPVTYRIEETCSDGPKGQNASVHKLNT